MKLVDFIAPLFIKLFPNIYSYVRHLHSSKSKKSTFNI